MMTYEQTMELIKSYIDDIDQIMRDKELSINDKQHMERAYQVYNDLYNDALVGKVDPDFLHENISSFLYMLQ